MSNLILSGEAQVVWTVNVGLVCDEHSASWNIIQWVIKYAAVIEKVLRFIPIAFSIFKWLYRKKDIQYWTEYTTIYLLEECFQPVDMMEGGGRDPQILARRSDLYQYPSRTWQLGKIGKSLKYYSAWQQNWRRCGVNVWTFEKGLWRWDAAEKMKG